MDPIEQFNLEKEESIKTLGDDKSVIAIGKEFMNVVNQQKYSYNFTWMGRPIIQYPQDIIALQEIIWNVKPDLIIETGIAHGGSLIFSASMLELLNNNGQVLGIDIDIREHNKLEIEKHPMSKRITMIQGSSVDPIIVQEVKKIASQKTKILIVLDSNHTHDHVLQELQAYSELVSVGSYIVVFDTVIEDLPEDYKWTGRSWGKGNNPKTAVWEFLKNNRNFVIDSSIHKKLVISVAPEGYLRRVN